MKIILLLSWLLVFTCCTNNPDTPGSSTDGKQLEDSLEPAGGEGISDSTYLRDTLTPQ